MTIHEKTQKRLILTKKRLILADKIIFMLDTQNLFSDFKKVSEVKKMQDEKMKIEKEINKIDHEIENALITFCDTIEMQIYYLKRRGLTIEKIAEVVNYSAKQVQRKLKKINNINMC